ncbi:MAG: hypothetical protein ACI8VC_002796 [Candidatus Endobugula sp.]|jgi:hypothetical protein
MLDRLRRAMVRQNRELLNEEVEVDETCIALTDREKLFSTKGLKSNTTKLLVAIAEEILQPKGFGRIRIRRIKKAYHATLLPFIRAQSIQRQAYTVMVGQLTSNLKKMVMIINARFILDLVFLRTIPCRASIELSPSKLPEFLLWIQKNNATSSHSCMEATGVYGALLAEYLFDQGIPISVVNPTRTKGFSQSEFSRTKNDKSDVSIIARFSAAMKLSLWAPEPINIRQLKAITMRLDALAEMKQQDIFSHIDKGPCLKNQKNLLLSISGIGEKTISKLLSYFSSVERFDNAKKWLHFSALL